MNVNQFKRGKVTRKSFLPFDPLHNFPRNFLNFSLRSHTHLQSATLSPEYSNVINQIQLRTSQSDWSTNVIMLIRTVIAVVYLSLNCVFGHQTWKGIPATDQESNLTPCSRRARRPQPAESEPPASKPAENSYSESNKYSSQLSPSQSSFRLLLPKNLDQPLDLYLESLAIKSEVIEGKLYVGIPHT